MKILLSGGTGGLGKEILKYNCLFDIFAPSSKEMDICDYWSIYNAIEHFKPDAFLHCAAMSAPMIKHDLCLLESITNNIEATLNIVKLCILFDIKMIYISTDFVYPGDKGNYKEDDPLYPINRYAWSKLGGECSVRILPEDRYLIFRCAFTDKPFTHKKALVDSYKSLIYVDEATKIMLKIIALNSCGVYNIGGSRKSNYEFALKENPHIEKIYRKDLKELMPYDTSMNCKKIKKFL